MIDWRDRLIVKSTPPPKRSKYLRRLHQVLVAGGCAVTSRGSPDFFCFRKEDYGRLYFFVVFSMRRRTYKLRRHQKAVAEALARGGIVVYRFDHDSQEFSEVNFSCPRSIVAPAWREQWRIEKQRAGE